MSYLSEEQFETKSLLPPFPPRKAHIDRPIKPDFSFLDSSSSNMMLSAYNVINKKEGWDIIANFDEEGFMICRNPVIKDLMFAVNDNYNGHSGCSLAWTMRQIECIAKYGYTEYRGLFDNNIISIL
jgi:hypothetical protein